MKNPAEFLFQISSDVYGIENLDAPAFMDLIAKMEEPVFCPMCRSRRIELANVSTINDIRRNGGEHVKCLDCGDDFYLSAVINP